ncbi:MAG: MliC family protein [bacterium]
MKIIWNKVTKFSQIIAIILFVTVFFTGILIGKKTERGAIIGWQIAKAKFVCADKKSIEATFYKNFVHIETNSLGALYLPQAISASGARYANTDESIVFWNKGNTAFITEGDQNNPAYKDCVASQ